MLKLLVGLTFLLPITTSNSINFDLVKSVQTFKNIKTLLIVTCETTAKSIVQATKHFQSNGTWINILNVSNKSATSDVNFESFFVRHSCAHIVVYSLTCHQSIRFLNEISKLKMFHGERNWLMFSDNNLENSVSVLRKQNINSDAEIMLALQDNQK